MTTRTMIYQVKTPGTLVPDLANMYTRFVCIVMYQGKYIYQLIYTRYTRVKLNKIKNAIAAVKPKKKRRNPSVQATHVYTCDASIARATIQGGYF